MNFYLIRHAETDKSNAPDPYSVPLSAKGREQAQSIAQEAQEWDLEMLCVSTMLRSMDTADPISEALPDLVRWDLEELEDLALEDLNYEPGATHLVSTWTDEQLEHGYISLWTRLMAAYQRIRLYAETYGLERIGIVAGDTVLSLLIVNWQGQDWRVLQEDGEVVSGHAVYRVTVADGEATAIKRLDDA